MINDIVLLQVMRHRENYDRYAKYVNRNALTKEGEVLFDDLGAYFKEFADIKEINDLDKFSSWFHHCRHLEFNKDTREVYNNYLIKRMLEKTDETAESIIKHYQKQELFNKILEVIKENGDVDTVEQLIKGSKPTVETTELYLPMQLEDILKEPKRENGLQWRLDILNKYLGGLVIGDFGVIAGIPNTGKTTFLISEVSYMAQQLPPNKKVLWFNNEGPDYEIRERIYQATLNKTKEEIRSNYNKSYEEYLTLMGNCAKIQVVKAAWQNYKTLEKIIMLERDNVGLIVFDMLDKVKGFERFKSSETADEKYDRAYEWALNLSITVAPVLGTSQTCYIDDIYKRRYPPMEALKGSRISKQGDARFMLMIGKDEIEEGFIATRFLSSPKNKVGVQFQAEVQIDKLKARYVTS